MNKDIVKIIDLMELAKGNPESLGILADSITNSGTGFAAFKNYSAPEPLITMAYSQMKWFFEQSLLFKEQYHFKSLNGQRGFVHGERGKGQKQEDLKQFYHYGRDFFDMSMRVRHNYPDNPIVKESPYFNITFSHLFKFFEKDANTIMQAIAIIMGKDQNYFDKEIEFGDSLIRSAYYYPITEEPGDAIRAAEHEDIDYITLLVGSSFDGLEVMDNNGDYHPFNPPANHMVMNIGDMLQMKTGGDLKSTTHRVVNPPKENWHVPRYSIPFFFHPEHDTVLNEDYTALEFLLERLKELGLLD